MPNYLSSMGTLILFTSISTSEKPGSKISALVSLVDQSELTSASRWGLCSPNKMCCYPGTDTQDAAQQRLNNVVFCSVFDTFHICCSLSVSINPAIGSWIPTRSHELMISKTIKTALWGICLTTLIPELYHQNKDTDFQCMYLWWSRTQQ